MKGVRPETFFGKEGILSERTKAIAERSLSTELDEHLSEERAQEPTESQNQPASRRNHCPAVHVYMHERGSSQKTVTTDAGKVVLDFPRDRNGTFDPVLIAKYQCRFPGGDTKIIHCQAGHSAAMSREGACPSAA
ncbi:transposase [Leisingera sp. NJS204]|uniref:transposase n=1 Tax=Leisingera sp. NJS204 TaxID=2508307 RepID=UPI0026985F67